MPGLVFFFFPRRLSFPILARIDASFVSGTQQLVVFVAPIVCNQRDKI